MGMYDGFGMFSGKSPENAVMLLENLVANYTVK